MIRNSSARLSQISSLTELRDFLKKYKESGLRPGQDPQTNLYETGKADLAAEILQRIELATEVDYANVLRG